MEASDTLKLVHQIYDDSNGKAYIDELCTDDDSTMHSLLTWLFPPAGKNNEQLPLVPEELNSDEGMKYLSKATKVTKRKKGQVKGGMLRKEVPQPRFRADPGHRTKFVAQAIYKLATMAKKLSLVNKLDTIKFKSYYGYMIAQYKGLTFEELKKAARHHCSIYGMSISYANQVGALKNEMRNYKKLLHHHQIHPSLNKHIH